MTTDWEYARENVFFIQGMRTKIKNYRTGSDFTCDSILGKLFDTSVISLHYKHIRETHGPYTTWMNGDISRHVKLSYIIEAALNLKTIAFKCP